MIYRKYRLHIFMQTSIDTLVPMHIAHIRVHSLRRAQYLSASGAGHVVVGDEVVVVVGELVVVGVGGGGLGGGGDGVGAAVGDGRVVGVGGGGGAAGRDADGRSGGGAVRGSGRRRRAGRHAGRVAQRCGQRQVAQHFLQHAAARTAAARDGAGRVTPLRPALTRPLHRQLQQPAQRSHRPLQTGRQPATGGRGGSGPGANQRRPQRRLSAEQGPQQAGGSQQSQRDCAVREDGSAGVGQSRRADPPQPLQTVQPDTRQSRLSCQAARQITTLLIQYIKTLHQKKVNYGS